MPQPEYIVPDEPLDLNVLHAPSMAEFDGHDRSTASRNNRTLNNIFFESQRGLYAPDKKLRYLKAAVRWGILKLGRKNMQSVSGIHQHSIQYMENRPEPDADRRPAPDTLHRLMEFWRKSKIPPAVIEQLLDLEQEKDGGDIFAFYKRLDHEHQDKLYKVIGKSRKSMWARKKENAIPSFIEGYDAINTLYAKKTQAGLCTQRLQQHEEVWRASRAQQYRARGLEDVYIEVLIAIEIHVAKEYGEQFSYRFLQGPLALSLVESQHFLNGKLPDWDTVEVIVREILETPYDEELNALPDDDSKFTDRQVEIINTIEDAVDEFAVRWQKIEQAEANRISYTKKFEELRQTQQIIYQRLGEWLGIQKPEERDDTYEIERGEHNRYRFDDVILSALSSRISVQAPRALLTALVARNHIEERELEDLALKDARRDYQRAVVRVKGNGLEVRIRREYTGVKPEEVAACMWEDYQHTAADVAESARRIKRIEGGEMKDDALYIGELDEIFNAIEKLKQRKVTAVMLRREQEADLSPDCSNFETIPECINGFATAVGSFRAMEDAMREYDDRKTMPYQFIQKMGTALAIRRGPDYVPESMPALPRWKAFFQAISTEKKWDLEDEQAKAVDMWYAAYPHYLMHGDTPKSGSDPLYRIIQTHIDATCISRREFAERLPFEFDAENELQRKVFSSFSQNMLPDWYYIHSILLAAGVKTDDPIYKVAQELHAEKPLADALKKAKSTLKKQDKSTWCRFFPGLTTEELQLAL